MHASTSMRRAAECTPQSCASARQCANQESARGFRPGWICNAIQRARPRAEIAACNNTVESSPPLKAIAQGESAYEASSVSSAVWIAAGIRSASGGLARRRFPELAILHQAFNAAFEYISH